MNYNDENNSINYDLFEKKERAKTNLMWFLGFGIIGTAIMLIAGRKEVFGNFGLLELFIAIPVAVIFLVWAFGSIPIGVRLLFKVIIPISLQGLGSCIILGTFIGFIVSPFILIRDIYYLVKKY